MADTRLRELERAAQSDPLLYIPLQAEQLRAGTLDIGCITSARGVVTHGICATHMKEEPKPTGFQPLWFGRGLPTGVHIRTYCGGVNIYQAEAFLRGAPTCALCRHSMAKWHERGKVWPDITIEFIPAGSDQTEIAPTA